MRAHHAPPQSPAAGPWWRPTNSLSWTSGSGSGWRPGPREGPGSPQSCSSKRVGRGCGIEQEEGWCRVEVRLYRPLSGGKNRAERQVEAHLLAPDTTQEEPRVAPRLNGNSQPLHLPGLSPSHPRHRSLLTRRWTTFRWTRRRPRPCRTPCRSGQTCGSPRSPPRAPSCDAPRPGRGPEAPSAEPASGLLALRLCSVPSCPPPLSSATLAFKALGIRDPDPFPLGGEGLIEALPPPSPSPPLIFISNGHPTLVRALAKKHPRASACPSDPNIYQTCGGRAAALSRLRASPAGLQLLGSPPRPRKRPHHPADQAAEE